MESESSICNIANDINNEVKEILTKYLSPHLAQMNQDRMNMKCIENILRGMPEFQRLEKENIELRRQLDAKESKHVSSAPAYEPAALVPEPAPLVPEPAPLVPEPAPLAPSTRCIKLDIIESPIVEDNVTNELELYKVADLLHIANNEASDEVEASANEVETEEEAEEASEAEQETEEEVETEAEEEEAEEETEAEASEAEQTEAEASEAEEEEEASEAEQTEAEASEAEEEEAEASEAEEEASEADEETEAEEEEEQEAEEEEVSLIVINGISYYTTNETSGDIYKVEGTDDVGDQVGKFVNKVATFF